MALVPRMLYRYNKENNRKEKKDIQLIFFIGNLNRNIDYNFVTL